jgi:cobalt-zinc-cadmium efflux system protein
MGHDHKHAPGANGNNEARIAIAVVLTGGFMLAEVVGGLISGSLALLADAGHMLTDFASLALAWFALRIARRPATWKQSYGFDRVSVLAAFVNGLALFLIAGWICWESVRRFREPAEILGALMFWVAAAGLCVNVIAFWILSRGKGGNLNVRAAALHVMGDLLASLGAIAASIIILTTGWTPIDPLLSILVALIILQTAWGVVGESGHILLEGTPEDLERRKVVEDLIGNVPGVLNIEHFHAWSITEERPMITLEAIVNPGADPDEARVALKERLRHRFGVDHATIEVRRGGQKEMKARPAASGHFAPP